MRYLLLRRHNPDLAATLGGVEILTMLPAKRLFLLLLVAIGCLAISPGRAWACTCLPPGAAAEELAKSTAVFAGKAIDLDVPAGARISSADLVRVTFQVYTVWKGLVHDTLVVTTARGSASCGYPFSEGLEYLVYAYGTETELEVGLCSRTWLLSAAGEDLVALGQGTSPPAGNPVQPVQDRLFERILVLAGGLAIQMVIVAAVVVFALRTRKPALRVLAWAGALYLFLGFVYSTVGLYCYNARNWEFYGGLSVPPLFCLMGISDLLMWPVYVWANLINGFGVLGTCRPS